MSNSFTDELTQLHDGSGPIGDVGASFQGNAEKVWARLYGRMDVAYAAVIALDFDNESTRMIAPLAGNLQLTTANLAAGREMTVVIKGGGSPGTFTLPAWIPQDGALPTGIAAGKTGTLKLVSEGTTDAEVRATWRVEP